MSFFTSIFNFPIRPFQAVRVFVCSVSALLLFLAASSFVLDPERIYLKKYLANKTVGEYVKTLLSSETGVESMGMERLVKLELGKESEAECFVIGSSRSLQASLRSESWLSDQCDSLANLGVSGGSFEDMVIFLSLFEDRAPKQIYIFLDPWGLSFNADVRWRENEEVYTDFVNELAGVGGKGGSYSLSLIANSVNHEYIKAAANLLLDDGLRAFPSFDDNSAALAPVFDVDLGHDKAVILQDGSLVYSSDYLSNASAREVGVGDYKISSVSVDSEAVKVLLSVVSRLEGNGHDITLVLSPYHPYVYSIAGNEHVTDKLRDVEYFIQEMAESESIRLIGGYRPNSFGCEENEFYDAIHPKFSCIAKLAER